MLELPGFSQIDAVTVALVVAVMIFAGLVHGALGLGLPLVSTPLLALMTDVRSAILITLLPTVTVNLLSIAKGGRWSESIGRFWPLVVFVTIGGVAGSWMLSIVDPAPFQLLLAGVIFLYLGVDRIRVLDLGWIQSRRLSLAGFGLAAGFLAGTVNVMVPVLIIYTLEMSLPPRVTVQVFNLCFLTGKLSQMVVFANHGWLDAQLALSTIPLAVASAGALMIGMRLRKRVSAAKYRSWLRYVMQVVAALLVAQFIVGA